MCFLKEGKRLSVRKREIPLAENEISTGLREYKGSRRLKNMSKIYPFSFALRCAISLILHHEEECSSESKIEGLKELFHYGTILVSIENSGIDWGLGVVNLSLFIDFKLFPVIDSSIFLDSLFSLNLTLWRHE